MANRSYLYSCSKQNTFAKEENVHIRDLSEWNYDIPLSYFILVSGNTALCPSLLASPISADKKNEYFALSGDFEIGLSRLLKLLNILETLFKEKNITIEHEIAATKEFLSMRRNDYIYLETIELDIMDFNDTEEFKTQALEYAAFAQKLGKLIDELPEDPQKAIEYLSTAKFGILGDEIVLLENISIDKNFDCSDKNFMLGITEWSNTLMYSLNSSN